MADKKQKKSRFVMGMVIYAAVFLAVTAAGLGVLWKYMEAYELSRPRTAVADFVEQLTAEQIRLGCEDFLSQIDSNIQTPDQAFQAIQDSLTEEITYVKNGKDSTSDRQVYILRQGSQVIGTLAIRQESESAFGFTPWQVTEYSFDFAHLAGEGITVTIPEEYSLSVNGNILDESYIKKKDIPFPALEDFAGDFEMVTLVTYRLENYLGELPLEILDPAGAKVTQEEDTNVWIPGCSEEEIRQLTPLLETFLKRYVAFAGSSNRNEGNNYYQLIKCLVPNGALAQRLYTALDGLQYAQSNGDTIREITVNHYYKVSQERYICDVTYMVETIGRNGAVMVENHLKVVFLQTEDGLKVEAMTRY